MYDPNRGYPKVVPYVLYADPAAGIAWLTEVLGLREVLRFTTPGGTIGHAELLLGSSIVMVGSRDTAERGPVTGMTLVFVDDVDVSCERATAAGGTVVNPPVDQPWGLRQAILADPEGHQWEVTQFQRDVPPGEWGAELLGPLPG